jgi:hypothetical protein
MELMTAAKLVNLGTNAVTLRDEFIAWQCRLRRRAMREAGGRPSPGMCPRAFDTSGDLISEAIVVLLARADSAAIAPLLEFQFKRTHDPLDRYEKAVTAFSAEYYQRPANFTGMLSALFAGESPTANRLLGRLDVNLHVNNDAPPSSLTCELGFQEANRAYRVPCGVELLSTDDPLYRATYWHNALFNPNLPPDVTVLAFEPDWLHASRQHES